MKKTRNKIGIKGVKKPALEQITEFEDESDIFGRSSAEKRGLQRKGRLLTQPVHRTLKKTDSNLIVAPQTLIFSDLSSIEASLCDELIGAFSTFFPVTGHECAMAIPISTMIIREMADNVVVRDSEKEIESKRRAVRDAMAMSWGTAFNYYSVS